MLDSGASATENGTINGKYLTERETEGKKQQCASLPPVVARARTKDKPCVP